MFTVPLGLPLSWLIGLGSLAILAGGLFLLVGWFLGIVVGLPALLAGVVMTAFSFLGRFLVLLFRPAGVDEPHDARAGEVERIVRPDGTELQVETYGSSDAPPLILTHGWGSDSTQWYYLKRALADRFRVVVWDLPGLGRSSHAGNHDYSLERLAGDLEAVVEHVADARTVVAGHSLGGMVLLTLWRQRSRAFERVAGLVLANTTHVNPATTTAGKGFVAALQKPLIEPLLHLTVWLFPLVWLMGWISYLNGSTQLLVHLTGFAGTETRGQLDYVARLGARQHPSVLGRQGLALLRHDATETLPEIDLPVLVIAASRDRVTIPEASAEMARIIPEARLSILTPSGHVTVFERHADLSAELAGFAREASQRRSEGTQPSAAEVRHATTVELAGRS